MQKHTWSYDYTRGAFFRERSEQFNFRDNSVAAVRVTTKPFVQRTTLSMPRFLARLLPLGAGYINQCAPL